MKIILSVLLLMTIIVSCKKHDMDGHSSVKGDIVYFESNDYRDQQNKIFAYLNKGDGKLEQIPGSPFPAGGSGVGDPEQLLGPLDSDNQLKLSPDGKFLLAVNPGSNTIAVFDVRNDGSLSAVSGSPFSSGGETPVSIDIKGSYVYVVNKSQDFVHTITKKPNYTVLKMNSNGVLSPLSDATVETLAGASPAQALVSKDGKFLFGSDFLGFMLKPASGTLRSFWIGSDGKLTKVAGTPQAIPEMGGALGLTQNPRDNTLYVGFPVTGKVGVYDINTSTGALNFSTAVSSGAAACWLRTAHYGSNMYALNSGENTISVFNTSSTKSPVLMNKVVLQQPGPLYDGGGPKFTTSQDFSFEFSPAEQFVYVVSQHTNKDFTVGNYNYLHVLDVAIDGNLKETEAPLQIPVPNIYRPQGVVVIHLGGTSK